MDHNGQTKTRRHRVELRYIGMFLALIVGVPSLAARAQKIDIRADLTKARATWQATRPSAYEFTIEVRCFCLGITKTAPSFQVVGDESSPVRALASDSERFYSSYNTIEKLFAAIEQSVSRGQYKSSVQFDEKFGFPAKADLDPRHEVIDEELYLRVIGFRVIEK